MKKHHIGRHSGGKLLLLILTVLAGGLIVASCIWKMGKQVTYSYTSEVFGNPLMGFAPCAWYEEPTEDIQLFYTDITWRELEPEEGVYAWDSIAEENQFDRWRAEGKHLVLRFVCDMPDDKQHMDIPEWLYEKIGGEGTFYDMGYGKGFAPDYNNPVMIQAHQRAVEAMGEYLGQDGFVAYVELGSLGHWGEWHVNYAEGIQLLPKEPVREAYITPWVEAFPHSRILMRRPFTPARKYGFGLYNDMTGHPEDTETWLEWTRKGGDFRSAGEKNVLVPMPDFWQHAPSGGEFTSSLTMKEMLDTQLKRTLELLEAAHTTFLGPMIADKDYSQGYEAALGRMGYRLWISKGKLQCLGGVGRVTLTWENSGVAPLYEDWPVYLYLKCPKTGEITQVPVEMNLSELLPGESVTIKVQLPWAAKGMEISVGIVDPMTGKAAVRLAMEAEIKKGKNGITNLLFPAN